MFNSARTSDRVAVVALCTGLVALSPVLGSAQTPGTEAALKTALEGRRVTLRMDMPGSSDGVDVRTDATRPIDFSDYNNDLRRYGVALRGGDLVPITLVKVKKDLVEVQLAGGGFGTFGDDTNTSADIPLVDKSSREKELEKRLKDEEDRDRRRRLENELDDLRGRRERENRHIRAERERIEEIKKERVAEQRLRGGSRFNVRYKGAIPAGLRPEDVVAALSEYVDFDGRAAAQDDSVPEGDITMLRKGMSRAEAERAFGRPRQSSERRDGGLVVATLVFDIGDQRVAADFVEDVLVKYTVTSK